MAAIMFLLLLSIIFCTFFSARLAQIKMRSKRWGALGFFFNIFGLIAVCFLPSKRTDGMQTNPIAHMLSKLPSLSRKTIGLFAGLVAAALLTLAAYDYIPVILQNYKYSKQVLNMNENVQAQPKLIETEIADVFAGSDSSYAVSEDGDVYCWGRQMLNHIEGAPRGVIFQNAKKVTSVNDAIFILTKNNDLYVYSPNPDCRLIPDDADDGLIATDVTDFSVSETTVGYFKSNKKLYMYGDNSYGQLGTYDLENRNEPEPVIGNVIAVRCESTFTVVLQGDGEAIAFGSNIYRQFAQDGAYFSSPVSLAKNISAIAVGDGHVMLLDNSGKLLVCGENDCGQLGNGTTDNLGEFTEIADGVTAIGAARKSSYALKSDGTLWSWGQNNLGQLGCGDELNVLLPTQAEKDVVSFSVSGTHALLAKSEKKLFACGCNDFKQNGRAGSCSSFSTLVSVK